MGNLTPDGIPTPYFDSKERTPFPAERRRLSWGESTITLNGINAHNNDDLFSKESCDDTTIFLRGGTSVKGTILEGIDDLEDVEEEDETITLNLPATRIPTNNNKPIVAVRNPAPSLTTTTTTSTTAAPPASTTADAMKVTPYSRSSSILEKMRQEELELERAIREMEGL